MSSNAVATPEMIRPLHQLMSNTIILESTSREMEKKLKSKGAKIEQLKKKIKSHQTVLARYSKRNNEYKRKEKHSIHVPNLPSTASDSRRDVVFKDAIESAAKICFLYQRNNTKAKKSVRLVRVWYVIWRR